MRHAILTCVVAGFLACAVAANAQAPGTPADGYTVHVLAPHFVDGKVMGLQSIRRQVEKETLSVRAS